MALEYSYRLAYYKEIESYGHTWRVEFYRYSPVAFIVKQIGPVLQALKLVVQGDQSDIDEPIVKTSLEMQFVDAPDLNGTAIKAGDWEEFYTSSSTEWKVQLLKDGVVEWTGYVTPDSFAEDLRYRGSVSIIARDNLGHLQDFDFDLVGNEDGMVSLLDIVEGAKAKVSFQMDIWYDNSLQHRWPIDKTDDLDTVLWDIRFNASAFTDKNWLESLESAMYAAGVTLRYCGENTFVLTPMRNAGMAFHSAWADVPLRDVQFVAFGRRELAPAAKRIKEIVNFEIQNNIADVLLTENSFGEESLYHYLGTDLLNLTMPVHAVVEARGWATRAAADSLQLNPFIYTIYRSSSKYGDLKAGDITYLASNSGVYVPDDSRGAEYSALLGEGRYDLSMTFKFPIGLYKDRTAIGILDCDAELSTFRIYALWEGDDGTRLRYNGSAWAEGSSADSVLKNINSGFPYTFSLPELTVATKGRIRIGIKRLNVTDLTKRVEAEGTYVALGDLVIQDAALEDGSTPTLEKLKVNTNYDDRNNITYERKPEFAPNPTELASPKIIINGMYTQNADGKYIGSESWVMQPDADPSALAVLIHKQILAWYCRPMNVLNGELLDLSGDTPDFSSLWVWNGRRHMLMSGTLNMLTGRIEGAVLREFERYDKMWEDHVTQDLVELDYIGQYFSIGYVSAEGDELYPADVPSWLQFAMKEGTIDFYAEQNTTGVERSCYVKVGTAVVKVVQRAAGDYNEDYNEDYS